MKTKLRRLWTGVFVFVCLLTIVGWQLSKPRIGHATLAEILAVLPPDLQSSKPVDETACKRMDRLIVLEKIDPRDLIPMCFFERQRDSSAHQSSSARALWAKHAKTFSSIERIVSEGPLQCRVTAPEVSWPPSRGKKLSW